MRLFSPDSRKKLKKFWKLLFIVALLAAFELNPWSSLVGLDSHPRVAQAGKKDRDKSDMNGDGVVDQQDLRLFSQELGLVDETEWTDEQWCQYIESHPKKKASYTQLFVFISGYYECETTPPPITAPALSSPTASEINIPSATLGATIVNDGGDPPIIERGTVWNTTGPPITENPLAEGGTALGSFSHVRTDFTGLVAGTKIYFRGYAVNDSGTGYSPQGSFIVPNPLAVNHANNYPTRLALGPNGQLFVSDPKVKSVFIYDANLQLKGELKGLYSPLGVAVDSAGFIYVGNAGIGNVEKYNSQGKLVATIGQGMIRAPTDLALDWDGNLYVADSNSSLVWVFKPDGALLRTIRKGGLKSPMAVEIAYYDDGTGQMIGEVFVADKGNYLVKVFDLQGNLKRSFGGFPAKGGMMGTTWYWKGKFISLQSLAVDAQGDLHALDIYMNRIQILDPSDGTYISDYGEHGTGAGQLKLPLDIIINNGGDVIVANSDNKKVEVIYTVP
jgi:hypothetical protein